MIDLGKKNIRKISMLGPRAVYGMALTDLVAENNKVYAVSADLGVSSGLARLMDSMPDRYINVGIAEQNMIGIAAGMAKEGLIPFVSSFAPFASLRCADQIRMNMGYMHLPVKITALGSGVSMGLLGYSHYGLEDIALLRAIPNIVILSPADCASVAKAVYAAADIEEPVYIRLTGEPGMPVVYNEEPVFNIGKANVLKEGNDIAIISTGSMVRQSLDAASLMEEMGYSVSAIDMHTIKPLDFETVDCIARKSQFVVTVEEHSKIGGLGSAVAEYLLEAGINVHFLRIGLNDRYGKAGDYKYMLEQNGLTKGKIVDLITSKIGH